MALRLIPLSINGKHFAMKTVITITVLLLIWTGCITSPTVSNEQVPTRLTVSSTQLNLVVGEKASLEAEVLDQNLEPIANALIRWSSSDTNLVGVDDQGLVTALLAGSAVITVNSGMLSAVVQVKVYFQGDADTDRNALAALHGALNGPTWTNDEYWLSDRPAGEWHGVTAGPGSRVISLHLAENALQGELPLVLGELDRLRELVLPDNDINGGIPPTIDGLVELEILDLSRNSLTVPLPPSLGNLVNLRRLNLRGNIPRGEIPGELGRLARLESLILAACSLTGGIPPELGNLARLEVLNLSANRLSGTLPPQLGNLVSLESLSIGSNRLTGKIPNEFGLLNRLKFLALSRNGLEGEIPPSLGGLARLETLDLRSNSFSGRIPRELGSLHKLLILDLARNRLSGGVPSSLGQLSNLLALDLSGNSQLTGPLPLEFIYLNELSNLQTGGTGLCAPPDAAFQRWLESRRIQGIPVCSGT